MRRSSTSLLDWEIFQRGLLALLFIFLAAVTSESALDQDSGIPDRAQLRSVSGEVIKVTHGKYGVRFKLSSHAGTFNYPSVARGNGLLADALHASGNKRVTVLFDPVPKRSRFTDDEFHIVWEVSIAGRVVRSVGDTQSGWRANNSWALWIFFACAAVAVYNVGRTYRAYVRRREFF
ncbi:hypothetical protein PEC18_25205 [Paucibacter sp. O1-1]|nr:hypothetical protein [Paucibacter sp. O1-1]MDA3829041.1 hypothetical protein [Paucibacter sp. O1-1]